MKVKKEILEAINTPEIRTRIASILKTVGEQAVYAAIKGNVDDGRMTKMDFLMAINEITGIAVMDILEPETVNQG